MMSGGGLASLGAGSFEVGAAAPGMLPGGDGWLCVRPEDVVLSASPRPGDTPTGNCLPGLVSAVIPQGPLSKVTVDCGVPLVAAVAGHLVRDLGLRSGKEVLVSLRPADLYVIPRS
jgi:ABC-type molybdate transport system ATPase subunit